MWGEAERGANCIMVLYFSPSAEVRRVLQHPRGVADTRFLLLLQVVGDKKK